MVACDRHESRRNATCTQALRLSGAAAAGLDLPLGAYAAAGNVRTRLQAGVRASQVRAAGTTRRAPPAGGQGTSNMQLPQLQCR